MCVCKSHWSLSITCCISLRPVALLCCCPCTVVHWWPSVSMQLTLLYCVGRRWRECSVVIIIIISSSSSSESVQTLRWPALVVRVVWLRDQHDGRCVCREVYLSDCVSMSFIRLWQQTQVLSTVQRQHGWARCASNRCYWRRRLWLWVTAASVCVILSQRCLLLASFMWPWPYASCGMAKDMTVLTVIWHGVMLAVLGTVLSWQRCAALWHDCSFSTFICRSNIKIVFHKWELILEIMYPMNWNEN